MRRRSCLITDSDRCRLGTLLSSGENRAWGKATCVRTLDARLEDAEAVTRQQTPDCLVTMNSTVELMDLWSGDRRRVTLVYPADRSFVSDSISVFEPFGTQLLGSQVGDVLFHEKRQVRITRVVYQPETAGDYHL